MCPRRRNIDMPLREHRAADFSPGQRVAFDRESTLYAEGFRTGTVVDTKIPVREFIANAERKYGFSAGSIHTPNGLPDGECWPIVRCDGCARHLLPGLYTMAVPPWCLHVIGHEVDS